MKAVLVVDIPDMYMNGEYDAQVRIKSKEKSKRKVIQKLIRSVELKPFPNKISASLKEVILLECKQYGNKELKECFEEILELEKERDILIRD